jgi:hypothetical protein
MATVELTLEQLRDAIIQLPPSQRKKLLEEVERMATADEAREAGRRVRGTFRLNAKQRKRMSDLLAKGNEGTLTADESHELNALADEFERRTLEMARELCVPST